MEHPMSNSNTWKTYFIAAGLYDGLEDACLSQLLVLLKSAHANPNFILPRKGIAPIHFAVGIEQLNFAEEATKLFLCYGADPNARTVDGQTPVHIAAAWGRTNILRLLLTNGGNPWLEDNDQKNAFDYACEEQHWDALTLLRQFKNGDLCSKVEPSEIYLRFDKLLIQKGNIVLEYAAPIENTVDKHQSKSVATQTDLPNPLYNTIKKSKKGKEEDKNYSYSKIYYNSRLNGADCTLMHQSDQTCPNVACKPAEKSSKPKQSVNPTKELLSLQRCLISELKSMQLSSKNCGATEKEDGADNQEKLLQQNHKSNEDACKCNNSSIKNLCEPKCNEELPGNADSDSDISILYYNGKSNTIQEHDICRKAKDEAPNFKPLLDMSDKFFTSDEEVASHSCFSPSGDKNSFEMHISEVRSCTCATETQCCPGLACANYSINNSNTSCRKLNFEDDSDKDSHSSRESDTDFFNQQDYETAPEYLSDAQAHVSVSEEYIYTDEEKKVTLLERRLLVPSISFQDLGQDQCEKDVKDLSKKDSICSSNEALESELSVPSSLEYATDSLRKKLVEKGCVPGPITSTTKRVYLKKLIRLEKHHTIPPPATIRNNERVYSPELQKTLKEFDWQGRMTEYMLLEKSVAQQFSDTNIQQNWREGVIKSSFAYILLDPRITNNLPNCASSCSQSELWTKFLSAIFYIGKGKRSRPYAHLYEAFAYWKKDCYSSINDKVQYILDIWKGELGVICLHVFQHVIPVEAYTREAAMIDAVSLRNLKNNRSGEYYGIASKWTPHQKRKWGTYLLYRAFCIFLLEGERQLRPSDIAS